MRAFDQFGPLQAMMHVQRQGEIGKRQGEDSRLAKLVSQGMSQPGGLERIAPEVASFNPDAAFKIQDQAVSQDERRQKELVRAAKLYLEAPQQMRGQVYSQIAPGLTQLGLQMPPQDGPEVEQAARALVQAYGGAETGTPAQVQVFEAQARAAGLQPGSPEYQKAAQIALGLQGRASSAGMGFDMVEDAQGVPRPQRRDPRTGTVEVFISEQNAWVPLGGSAGQASPQPRPQQPQTQRYPTAMVLENEQGEPDPFNNLPPAVRAEADRLAAAGQPFHIANGKLVPGLSAGVTNQPTQQPVNQGLPSIMDVGGGDPAFNASPFGRGRTKEQEAAAVRAAEKRVDLQYAPAQAAVATQAKIDEMQAESAIKPTKAQEAVDSQYGKEYVEFLQGGAADANKALSELSDVLEQLETEGGPSMTGPLLGMLPNSIKTRTNPDAMAAQETVESTVQRSLRVILGAQFTEKEGERLIARAYNPSLGEEENAKRVRRLYEQLKQGFENKAAMARYYEENGTLRGFTGKLPSWGDFDPDSPAPRKAGGQQTPAAGGRIRFDAQGNRI